jgi:mRNA-degrading endonuclease RelE of RelBE toxin-antitoxin system
LLSLNVHQHAVDDLMQLLHSNNHKEVEAASDILVFLQELKSDQQFVSKLLTVVHNQTKSFDFNVKQWRSAKKLGNLWRLRILDTPATNYRVIYGYHWQPTMTMIIFAVVDKDQYDYDNLKTEINQRIISDWNSS